MRLFTYMCPVCHTKTERDVPGTEAPPDILPHQHEGCANDRVMRVWSTTSLNLGYRPGVHDSVQQWMYKNG
jgi:hypothetical protein